MLDRGLKQRLVGAAVLVSLAVIFVPMLLTGRGTQEPVIVESNIPPQPEPVPEDFISKVIPLETPAVPQPDALPQPEPPASESAAGVSSAAQGEESKPQIRAGLTAWVVQLGSFSSSSNAEALRDKLREKGFTAFVEPFFRDGNKTYRVRVGPELEKRAAEELLGRLEQTGDYKGIVVRYP